jgi:Fe-S oxidoreductase
METNGNPWPLSWDQRGKWAEGSNVKVLSESLPKTDYLLWIGCAGSTDERNTKVAMALVRVLQKAGIDFAILGNQERCCGEPARRLGNDYLYQMLVQENMENFKQYQFKQIITYCPHCYNSFKNEYPVFPQSGDANTKWNPVPVIHHTQLIKHLINEGKLKIDGKLDKVVTYHDSCYLGRYNQIYEEPRTILKNIKSVQLKEMKRNKLESFCCGAGGGRMWLEEKIGKRINQIRTEEARETGADIIATACPYCLTMLGDGIKEKGLAETMKAKDIAEIVDETMTAQA